MVVKIAPVMAEDLKGDISMENWSRKPSKGPKRIEGLETSSDLDKEIAQRTNQSRYQGCSQDGVQHPY